MRRVEDQAVGTGAPGFGELLFVVGGNEQQRTHLATSQLWPFAHHALSPALRQQPTALIVGLLQESSAGIGARAVSRVRGLRRRPQGLTVKHRFGNFTSLMPRLPIVVPSMVSSAEIRSDPEREQTVQQGLAPFGSSAFVVDMQRLQVVGQTGEQRVVRLVTVGGSRCSDHAHLEVLRMESGIVTSIFASARSLPRPSGHGHGVSIHPAIAGEGVDPPGEARGASRAGSDGPNSGTVRKGCAHRGCGRDQTAKADRCD